jgi:hypothetical protein
MSMDFAQVKATKNGFITGQYGYRASFIINIQGIYESIFQKSFPMKRLISDDVYDCLVNCDICSDYTDKYYIPYMNDLKEFPLEEFKRFNNLTIDDFKTCLDRDKNFCDYLDVFQDDEDLMKDNFLKDKLDSYKNVFKEILKYVEDGYIYYYIIQ